MLDFISKSISKIFGSKSDRDIKSLLPVVAQINAEYAKLAGLSNDELRDRTRDFRARIRTGLQALTDQIEQLKQEADSLPMEEILRKTSLFDQVDELIKERDRKLEEILQEILPEAFAVVKETARRFKSHDELEVTASELDRELAVRKKNIRLEGDKAFWANTWEAAGNMVKWDMLHYDVQLIGGMVLHSGKISEMATGEGKTLVATLPAYLNALSGYGVHIVTVNDYLARRDSEWMGPLFEFHGITIDCIDRHQPNSPARRKAYQADITYGTNNEFGFDYLRDNMARGSEELVQRKHHYAMVDEVDSVLIDDARTPLIISGPVPRGDEHEFFQMKPRIERLVELQKRYVNTALADAKKLFAEGKNEEAGMLLLRCYRALPKNKALIKFLSESGVKALLLKTEGHYLQDQQKEMHKVDEALYFVIDEKNNSIELTEKGIEQITASGEDTSFFILPDVGAEMAEIEKMAGSAEEKLARKEQTLTDFSAKSERIHTLNQLLKAYTLFEKDVEYIVDQNKIKIVDEQTGRVLDGRRYSDGLHQAIEAKENVKIEAATQTFATITLQNFFRMYHKLAGMTGTAETEAGEFWEIYKLDVVVIPTNKSITRKDMDDKVFKTTREKYNAVIEEIERMVNAGRPVLVGTTSVEISELLSRMLQLRKIRHNVLNAKLHQREAEIVAEAGQAGTVTIATNMAGRGTDIKLGPGVKEAGGLAIIGTERHESRRVDRQLRGRAGRQGDPGSSLFFVSLEDNLMRLFGSERIAGLMDRFGYKEGEVIEHSMITKSIERAQKKVEENNFGIRKRLLEYDDVMNSQREVIYKRRRHALFGDRLSIDIDNMFADVASLLVERHKDSKDFEEFGLDVIRTFAMQTSITAQEFESTKSEALAAKLYEEAIGAYRTKNTRIREMAYPILQQMHQHQGHQINQVAIPFVMGNREMHLNIMLSHAISEEGKNIITEFEKGVVLNLIDEEWKEHLREMDDLKQSVQNAVYEQKDPLLVYKFEAFELFKKMLDRLSMDTVGMLAKGHIPVSEGEEVREAEPELPAPPPQYQTSHPQYTSSATSDVPVNYTTSQDEAQRPQSPVRVGPKIGRNDPCPCGSGKKFKNCHGKDGDLV